MFQLRLVRIAAKGQQHLLNSYAAAVRGYGRFALECGRTIQVPMRLPAGACIPIGEPFDPDNVPVDLCRDCKRLCVM